ncbi:DNA replication/repair protein RecF [Pseudoxanthomonas broegbernensis]|uniref:DNA replication and repair protein RecF n=1 Tax=Pseudoxanthomonas broegbernensis TaxID=83619 RepID=A0A7V8GN58_9GAMM|nr:DNA replication/repair protein RecF [Pseudoxanthomonas broegbernensis]KAF1686832.1 DNA replication/repair protein RecF [Pseudoxanthomonas broegbernensis]MBB6065582.1 DNA replication and repair protein RecF [Pseudoxanthomonas broegbernensis]
MRVTRLALRDLRRFQAVEMAPAPGLNLLTGGNGAGKTSVLEALHLMAYGRSFRGRVRDGLIRDQAPALEVFVEWEEMDAADMTRTRRAGLRHAGQAWTGRLDGEDVAHLGQLCAALAVVTFEPGSHALIAGGAENRRRYLDWGLFHVEQDFMFLWRRYARALKQRNALLKAGGGTAQLDAWDRELAETGEALTVHRERYLAELAPRVAETTTGLSGTIPLEGLEFQPGWRRQEFSLADALLLGRERDRLSGHTGAGPHRADWSVRFKELPGREALSRGQTKLLALAVLLAQAGDYAARRGQWPVIALDDLPSELDRPHQQRVFDHLRRQSGLQLFVTATEAPPVLADMGLTYRLFHVEQGHLSG